MSSYPIYVECPFTVPSVAATEWENGLEPLSVATTFVAAATPEEWKSDVATYYLREVEELLRSLVQATENCRAANDLARRHVRLTDGIIATAV
ncbi:MAG: hypothetical protein FWD59_07010 [Micrococcales bacterium]|nr:hypothetical protein [Micrococcales bacterium]